MKRTIQLVSLAAAAGMIVGCSSSNREASSDNNNSNPTPGTSYNAGSSSDVNATASARSNTEFSSQSLNSQGTPQINTPGSGSEEQATSSSSSSSSGKSGFLGLGGKEVTIDQLPQAAQTTIHNQIGDQQIAKIRQETKDGQTAYKVELQKKTWHSMRGDLIVAADGSILKESHMEKVNEAAGAQTPQAPSEANPSGNLPTGSSTNSAAPQQ